MKKLNYKNKNSKLLFEYKQIIKMINFKNKFKNSNLKNWIKMF